MNLHRQLSRQAQVIEEAGKYQKEIDNIIADNEKLHDEVDNIKTEYNKKEFEMELKYTNTINKLEKEKIDEIFDPSIALQRAIDLYRTKGYEEEWIARRMKSIQERKKLTDVWK